MTNNIIFQTNTIFFSDSTVIKETEVGTIVRMPENPTYYFGNIIYLNQPPKNEDKAALEILFKQEFAANNVRNHFTFLWDGNDDIDLSEYIKNGYEFEEIIALALTKPTFINPKTLNTTITIKPFSCDSDWKNLVKLEVEERPKGHEINSYRTYAEKRIANVRLLAEKGVGNYFGAFIGDELTASMGLFFKNNLARFQAVTTRTAHRRKKICTTLLNHVINWGFQKADELVIVADANYHALKLYENFGFQQTDSQSSICWWE